MKKVGLIGKTNVGKSTLFNRLLGENKSIVSEIAGTTRDFIIGEISVSGKKFELIDFGGIDFGNIGEIEKIVRELILKKIKDLDLILFVVDGKNNIISDQDKKIAEIIRKNKIEVIVVASKVDSEKQKENTYNFYQFGFDNVIDISAINNRNLDLLSELVIKKLKIKKEKEKKEDETNKITIIGRPNVGKSTLFNILCNEERSIVSKIAGTTRDSIDSKVVIGDKKYLFIDTAGLKRRTKISYILDKFSAKKSLNAIDRSDIVLYLISSDSYIVNYDIRLITHAWEKGKNIIIVISKWDKTKAKITQEKYRNILISDNSLFLNFPFVFISAIKKEGIDNLFKEIKNVEQISKIKIPTPVINKEIKLLTGRFTGIGKAKIFYAVQTSIKPVEILLFVNNPIFLKKNFLNFLEKNLRERFHLLGVPIFFRLKERSR